MRCFFMKKGRICAVEFLHQTSDDKRIAESMEIFKTKGLAMGAEGFEIWDHSRFVYRFVIEDGASTAQAADGLKGRPGWLERLAGKLTFKRALPASPLALAHA